MAEYRTERGGAILIRKLTTNCPNTSRDVPDEINTSVINGTIRCFQQSVTDWSSSRNRDKPNQDKLREDKVGRGGTRLQSNLEAVQGHLETHLGTREHRVPSCRNLPVTTWSCQGAFRPPKGQVHRNPKLKPSAPPGDTHTSPVVSLQNPQTSQTLPPTRVPVKHLQGCSWISWETPGIYVNILLEPLCLLEKARGPPPS